VPRRRHVSQAREAASDRQRFSLPCRVPHSTRFSDFALAGTSFTGGGAGLTPRAVGADEHLQPCSCLNVIQACIVYWQASEISRVLNQCDRVALTEDEGDLAGKAKPLMRAPALAELREIFLG
jgi:hypothetical protein